VLDETSHLQLLADWLQISTRIPASQGTDERELDLHWLRAHRHETS